MVGTNSWTSPGTGYFLYIIFSDRSKNRSLSVKTVGEKSAAKNYCPVSILFEVSKVFEQLVNNRIVDHLEKCCLFSDFQYGFRYSRSTADLLAVVSNRISRTFNRSEAT